MSLPELPVQIQYMKNNNTFNGLVLGNVYLLELCSTSGHSAAKVMSPLLDTKTKSSALDISVSVTLLTYLLESCQVDVSEGKWQRLSFFSLGFLFGLNFPSLRLRLSRTAFWGFLAFWRWVQWISSGGLRTCFPTSSHRTIAQTSVKKNSSGENQVTSNSRRRIIVSERITLHSSLESWNTNLFLKLRRSGHQRTDWTGPVHRLCRSPLKFSLTLSHIST